MVSCLVNWIGIYGTPESDSGVSINQLPGIELASLEAVSKPEQETYIGVWNDIQERGIRKFENRLSTQLTKKYKLKQLKSTVDLGNIIDKSVVVAGTNQYRGFVYELNQRGTARRSDYQALYVHKLKLYLQDIVNTTLKIVDLDTGEVLYTHSLTGAIGWNNVSVNQTLFGSRFMFCYDDAGIDAVKLEVNQTNVDWFNTMHRSICDCDASINGAVTVDKTQIGNEPIDVSKGNNTYGLSGIFSLVCTYESLICNNRKLLTTSLWYCLGIEVMLEILFSNRLNKFTTVDKQKASDNLQYFEKEFESELEILVDGIYLNTSDSCIDCNTQIEVLEAHV